MTLTPELVREKRLVVLGDMTVSIDPIAPTRTEAHGEVGRTLHPFRCPVCHRMLYRGVLRGEIKCRSCGVYITIGM
jgi:hypothetical protein